VPLVNPSIFNDVIGPVMVGPSSSHCAAGVRMGRIARDLMDGDVREVRIEYDSNGSFATTHATQGTDVGICAGLMGWETSDSRIPTSIENLKQAGTAVDLTVRDCGFDHPTTTRLYLRNDREEHQVTFVSKGGGAIEVIELDSVRLSMTGDRYETLVFCDSAEPGLADALKARIADTDVRVFISVNSQLAKISSGSPLSRDVAGLLEDRFRLRSVKNIAPVMPVLSHRDTSVAFVTADDMLDFNQDRGLQLWELAIDYEKARGDLSTEEVMAKMTEIVEVLRESIKQGLAGTSYDDRILGAQSPVFAKSMESDKLLDVGMLNRITKYVTALMEVKSAWGPIVAAPTAGSCGALPGAVLGAADEMEHTDEEVARSLLAAGLIGVFIAQGSTLAAEVGGCQAECGAGSGMAAAALVTLAGGNLNRALAAASMALQNSFGMTCDPVAKRVEVPCLGKNVMAAANAVTCANMALAGFDQVIPLDETIEAMDAVGKSLPRTLRCTGLGGLSVTKTSQEIETRLPNHHDDNP